MHRIRLIHWDIAEAEERARHLRAPGYDVTVGPVGPAELRMLRNTRCVPSMPPGRGCASPVPGQGVRRKPERW